MPDTVYDTVIIGGGISGLVHLHRAAVKGEKAILFEKESIPGGKILTETFDNYLLEWGPNSFILETHVEEFLKETGLYNEIVYPEATAQKRYILKNSILHELAPHPKKILSSPLFSLNDKLKLITESFRKKRAANEEESVASFIRRRFGKGALDYAVDPMLAGIYAGDPEKLSMEFVFPLLVKWEKEYGSVIKGLKKNGNALQAGRKIFAFPKGNNRLVRFLAEEYAGSVCLNSGEIAIGKEDQEYFVHTSDGKAVRTRQIIFTVPAYEAASMLQAVSPEISMQLRQIFYAPMMVMHLAYPRESQPFHPDSFGFLVPAKERKLFLGAIWDTAIFPFRSPRDMFLHTLFAGGMRDQHLFEKYDPETLAYKVEEEYRSLLKISGGAELIKYKLWPQAIPQYNIGYRKVLGYIENFERQFPGIQLKGNYRGGVGVKDCIISSARGSS